MGSHGPGCGAIPNAPRLVLLVFPFLEGRPLDHDSGRRACVSRKAETCSCERCSDVPTIQLKITPAGMGLQVRAPDRRDQHHLGPAGNADTWASPETQWIRNPGAAAQRALTPARVGRPRTCGWRSSASLRAPVQRRRGQITRTLRGERSGAGGDRRLWPSPDPGFY